MNISRKFLSFLCVSTLFIIFISSWIFSTLTHFSRFKSSNPFSPEAAKAYFNSPHIYLYNWDGNGYSSGGLITQTSLDEPSIGITAYNLPTDKFDIDLYRVDEQFIYDYLLYDKEFKQINKPDLTKYEKVSSFSRQLESGDNNYDFKISLPIAGRGIWYLNLKSEKVNTNAIVLRSDSGAVVKEGDNEFIFWIQDIKTRKSIENAEVVTYNLQDQKKLLSSMSTDADGIAKTSLTAETDIAVIKTNGDLAVIPVNLKYLNYDWNYKQFNPKVLSYKFFTFTDRPIYRPGDEVYFKSIVRKEDDVRYYIPEGSVDVVVSQGWGDETYKVYEGSLPVSSFGSVSGKFILPKDAKTGNYTLSVKKSENDYSYTYFDVEYYRKPEYFLDVITNNKELISGDNLTVKISGQYFSGHPLANQKVHYKVYSTDYYEYDYYYDYEYFLNNDDYRYWWWYGSQELDSGTVTLDDKGVGEISLSAKLKNNNGKNQVVSVEVDYTDPTGNPVNDRRNFLVYAGDFAIFRTGYNYGSEVNTPFTLPLKVLSHKEGMNIEGISLKADVRRESWVSYQEEGKKYPSYRKEEENLPSQNIKTDANGETEVAFTPSKTGSYVITVSGNDKSGNEIKKEFYSYIWDENSYYYGGDSQSTLSLYPEKPKYEPGETAKIHINSEIADRDVFLTLERGRVNRYQIVKMEGKNSVVDIPLLNTDIPNIYAFVASFNNNGVDSAQSNIKVNSASKNIKVKITPNTKKLGPGETVVLDIETTDEKSNPVQSELAVWMVDKSLYELSSSKLGSIFDAFWYERYNDTRWAHSLEGILIHSPAEMGGCFITGTKILMSDGKYKNIEELKAGDYILTKLSSDSEVLIKAKIKAVNSTKVGDYLVLNGKLKITADHKIFVNRKWDIAGNIQLGDTLLANSGEDVRVTSIEHIRRIDNVYNLEVEKYNTFFADSIYVHNQKGDGARSLFKDTAYWNASVWTDTTGHAILSVKLPDNLTTWAISAVSVTNDTRVGQATNEVVVSKDIVIRPVVANILREGDSVQVSAIVHNFTDSDKEFNVGLKFDSGDIESATQEAKIASQGLGEVYWKISPRIAKEDAKLTFSAIDKNNKKEGDTVIQKIPVRLYGFPLKRGEVGDGSKTYDIILAADSINKQSTVTLSLASNIIGTLPVAMRYLINYPYGCIEQTTSRFVPVVIAKDNPILFSEAMEDKDVDEMINKGLERIVTLQSKDGGWGWWHESISNPYISAYVVEYLLKAQNLGYTVDQAMMNKAVSFFENLNPNDESTKIIKFYALTLLNSDKRERKITISDNISADIMALGVMANYSNGVAGSDINGLNKLISKATVQGESLYWQAGDSTNFGSIDASTALALRAILFAQGDRDIAVKASRYLTMSRKSDYWSNTFATAQVVRALVELSKTGNEMTPNYSYKVSLDGKLLREGNVTNANQIIKDIKIPVEDIKQSSSKLEVIKEGEGQLYSTLVISEFRTKRNYQPDKQPLKITRKITNEKGENYSFGAGDTVNVTIRIEGLSSSQSYGVIEDYLPAGMVPINEALNNEGGTRGDFYYYYSNYGKEYQDDGVIMSLNHFNNDTFSYKARVINPGTYFTPPAVASLMYSPEVYGVSDALTIKIERQSTKLYELPSSPLSKLGKNVVSKFKNMTLMKKTISIIFILLISLITALAILKREKILNILNRKKNLESTESEASTTEEKENQTNTPNNDEEKL